MYVKVATRVGQPLGLVSSKYTTLFAEAEENMTGHVLTHATSSRGWVTSSPLSLGSTPTGPKSAEGLRRYAPNSSRFTEREEGSAQKSAGVLYGILRFFSLHSLHIPVAIVKPLSAMTKIFMYESTLSYLVAVAGPFSDIISSALVEPAMPAVHCSTLHYKSIHSSKSRL